MNKNTDIVKMYQQWCMNNRYVESISTASMFVEKFLDKETKINSVRIYTLYDYIEQKVSSERN